MARDFTKIKAWQLADDLAVQAYKVTRQFPREEIYGLTSQLRRAASSVPANIAEGSNRTSGKDYLHFLSVASGSLAEAEVRKVAALAEETSKTLTGLMSYVRNEIYV